MMENEKLKIKKYKNMSLSLIVPLDRVAETDTTKKITSRAWFFLIDDQLDNVKAQILEILEASYRVSYLCFVQESTTDANPVTIGYIEFKGDRGRGGLMRCPGLSMSLMYPRRLKVVTPEMAIRYIKGGIEYSKPFNPSFWESTSERAQKRGRKAKEPMEERVVELEQKMAAMSIPSSSVIIPPQQQPPPLHWQPCQPFVAPPKPLDLSYYSVSRFR